MDQQKIIEITKDIDDIKQEIIHFETGTRFDRQRAIELIHKQNLSDEAVAIVNSPLNSNFITFDVATNESLYSNLKIIRTILNAKLLEETKHD